LNRELLPKLADALAQNQEFCSIVNHYTRDRAERLDAIVNSTATAVGYAVPPSSSVSQGLTTRLIREDPTNLSAAALRLQGMFTEYHKSKKLRVCSQRNLAKRVGFQERNVDSGPSVDVPAIELDSFPMPSPPEGPIVLKRNSPTLPAGQS